MTAKTKWQIGIALVLVPVAAIYLTVDGARRRLDHYKTQLQSQGIKLSMRELNPPWVSVEENGGPYLLLLTEQLLSGVQIPEDCISTMRLVAPGRARVAWQQPIPMDLPLKASSATNLTWEWLAETLDAKSNLLAEIRETLTRPHLDFHLDFSLGFSVLLPHLAKYKGLAQYVTRTVLVQLRQGDLTSASDNLHALLRFAHLATEEPLAVSQAVQMAVTQIAMAATWEALQTPGWNEQQLARMQRDWETLNFILPMKNALGMERAIMQQFFAKARQSLQELNQVESPNSGNKTGSAGEDVAKGISLLYWQIYASYSDELHYLHVIQIPMAYLDKIQSGTAYGPAFAELKPAFERFSSAVSHAGMDHYLTRQFTPSYENLLAKITRAETARRLVVTAIALERYRRLHAKSAPNLAALSPQFLTAIPQDPLDAKPLRYHPGTNGIFQLYSIGEDNRDDGGDAKPRQIKSSQWSLFDGRDWVWPAAATPEEVNEAAAGNNSRK